MSRLSRFVTGGTALAGLTLCGLSFLVAGCGSNTGDQTASNTTPPAAAAAPETPAPAETVADKAQDLAADTAASLAEATPDKTDKAATRPAKPRGTQVPADPETFPVKISPTLLDLGEIPTGDTGRGMIKLINTGPDPVLLNQCKTSCGCTTANCPRGRHLKPGEEVEVEISLKGGQIERKLSKKVTIIFEDNQTLDVQVQGQAVAFVVVEPDRIDPEQQTDGRMTVRAKDGQAFRITKMTPSIVTADQFSADPLEEHVIYMDWERWKELGSARKLTFYTDHPKTERIMTTVNAKRTVQPTPSRKGPLPSNNIATAESHVKAGKIDELMKLIEEEDTLDLESTDRSGLTLLALAAKYGSVDVAEALVKAGADVEFTDKVGRTALMTAAQTKHPEVVQVLLDAGASLTPRDLVGSTALSWGSGFGDAESVRLLIAAGADLEVHGQPTGFTPVIWAAGFSQDPDTLGVLIEAGANLEVVDLTHGMTPLMHASRTGNVDKIETLVAAGANLEARDDSGKTPLLVACEASGATASMIQALIDSGADLNATDTRGQTALDLARKRTDPRAEQVRNLVKEKLGNVD